jgi:glucose-6-phosphate isomerase
MDAIQQSNFTAMPTLESLKDRTEATVINLLNQDTVLAALNPQQQAANHDQLTNPRIAVVATVSKEYVLGSGIFKINVAIEIFCNISESGQTPDVMEDYSNRVDTVLAAAQAAGTVAIIRNGGQVNFNSMTAKRTINVTILGA